jgi:hypothetical protein
MSADGLLVAVLRTFQSPQDPQQVGRIFSTTTSLLTTLSNPLNITLLTSQFLTAPAIWTQPYDLKTCLRIMSVFNTAAIHVHKHEKEVLLDHRPHGGISCDDWAKAAIQGADDRSPRWRHLLVIGGVLLGMEGQARQGLSKSLKSTLERAMVTAANLALLESTHNGPLGAETIVLALNHTFDLLSDTVKQRLDFDKLGPTAARAMVTTEGFQDATFLGATDLDVIQVTGKAFDFSPKSTTFLQLQRISSKPLVSSMGPLSRMIAYAIEGIKDPRNVLDILQMLESFTANMLKQWRQTKLSEIDASEETAFLTPDSLKITLPVLWQMLKGAMFATVVILRSAVGRTLVDPVLASDHHAPEIASSALLTLRNIYFISSRLGQNAFSAYTFVSLTSLDILSHYPGHARNFLVQIKPNQLGSIPAHPLERTQDLYYLNASEHFSLTLSPDDNESLLISASAPYLNPGANPVLLPLLEAAHSCTLSVLSAPQNHALTIRLLPFYTSALFSSFPVPLSPRQFRFAFATLIKITAAPSSVAANQPDLPNVLLELLFDRAKSASASPLPPPLTLRDDADALLHPIPLSEQAILHLTLLDSLPHLPLKSLEEWLPLAAEFLNMILDRGMRRVCQDRFWDLLNNGEMDVERSAVCVAWWTTRSGREDVLYGNEGQGGAFMSGGLPVAKEIGSRL